jgi:hypothetical protein
LIASLAVQFLVSAGTGFWKWAELLWCFSRVSGADAEGERDNARRHSQDLRVLLDRVLREVNNLPDDLRAAIEKVLAL